MPSLRSSCPIIHSQSLKIIGMLKLKSGLALLLLTRFELAGRMHPTRRSSPAQSSLLPWSSYPILHLVDGPRLSGLKVALYLTAGNPPRREEGDSGSDVHGNCRRRNRHCASTPQRASDGTAVVCSCHASRVWWLELLQDQLST